MAEVLGDRGVKKGTLISDSPPDGARFDWPKYYQRAVSALACTRSEPISVGIPASALMYLLKRSGVQVHCSCELHETVKKK